MENLSENINQDIREFVAAMGKKYGYLPKFCHNLQAPEKKVYYAGAYFDDLELSAAINALLFGQWSSSGEICAQFEKKFSDCINQKYSFFTNSGSSANLLLLAATKEYFKWSDDDEILVSAVGFPTTVSSIVHNKLKPVFVDIEWETLNFNLELLESKISSKTKAVFLSPVLGNPPDMDVLIDFCNNNNIKLLLDNCDSLGSQWKGKYLNEYAVVSSCSFYPAHEISTLEGGMVSSNIPEIVQYARSYATWGRACHCVGTCNLLPNGVCQKRFSNWISEFPDLILDHKYVFERMGWNLKPLDLTAAIGIEQLKKLNFFYSKRVSNLGAMQEIFSKHVSGIRFPTVFPNTQWVPFGVPIICKDVNQKRSLVVFLEKNGIQTRNYFAGNLLIHPGYKHLDDYSKYTESNKVLDLVFFVGCAPSITEANLNYIDKVLEKYGQDH